MGEEDTNSFFVQLEHLTERLKHQRLAEVFRTISFHASETYGPHAHLRIEINYVKRGSCILHLEDESVIDAQAQKNFPGIIDGHSVLYYGICSDCAQ